MKDKISIKLKNGPEVIADVTKLANGDLDIRIGGIFGIGYIIEHESVEIALIKLYNLYRSAAIDKHWNK